MKLYEIANEYVQLLDKITEIIDNKDSKDLITNQAIDNLLSLAESDVKQKSINVAAYIKNLESEIELMDNYIKKMAKKKKSTQNKIEGIKNYLRFNMEKTNINKISSPEFNISLGIECVKTDIFNEDILDITYCRKVEKWEPDKTKIKEALLDGKIVDGARLVRTRRLTIS